MALIQYTEEEWKIYNELKAKAKKISIDDARLMFLNFSGAEGPYNDEGDRNFCVRLDNKDILNKALESGYNVKYKNEGDEQIPYLKVTVDFENKSKKYPCHVFMKSNKRPEELREETVSVVDEVDIIKANLIIQPKPYVLKNGNYGIKALLNKLYLTVSGDKYADDFFGYEDNFDEEDEIPFD